MGLGSLNKPTVLFICLYFLDTNLQCRSCSPPRNWRSKGVSLRATRAEYILIGKVVKSPYTSKDRNKKSSKENGPYNAKFHVVCSLKGKVSKKYITVSGFGYVSGHCTNSRAFQNETYIMFLRKRKGHFKVAEVNSQAGTSLLKMMILRKVVRRLDKKGQLNISHNSCTALLTKSSKTKRMSVKRSKLQDSPKAEMNSNKPTPVMEKDHAKNNSKNFKFHFPLIIIALYCAHYLLT